MASTIERREKLLGSELIMDHSTWGDTYYFIWERNYIASTVKYEFQDEYTLEAMQKLLELKDQDYSDLHGHFKNIDDAFDFVKQYIQGHEPLQNTVKQWNEEEKEAERKRRETARIERAKYYHLELKDLTPEHELYYSDLISTRLKNFLSCLESSKLADICKMERRDLKEYRNCGEKTIQELEALLHQVGLDWGMKEKEPQQGLSDITDEQLLAECMKRGLIG